MAPRIMGAVPPEFGVLWQDDGSVSTYWMKLWDSNGDLEAMLTVSRAIGTSQHADAPSWPS
jgi:hypothetical protein